MMNNTLRTSGIAQTFNRAPRFAVESSADSNLRDNDGFASGGQTQRWPAPTSKSSDPLAGVAELVDAADSKSAGSDTVRVRVPSPAPTNQRLAVEHTPALAAS